MFELPYNRAQFRKALEISGENVKVRRQVYSWLSFLLYGLPRRERERKREKERRERRERGKRKGGKENKKEERRARQIRERAFPSKLNFLIFFRPSQLTYDVIRDFDRKKEKRNAESLSHYLREKWLGNGTENM